MGKKKGQIETALTKALDELDADSFSVKMLKTLMPLGDCNTNERAYEIRMLLESPEIDDYPGAISMERTWKFLSQYYGDWAGEPLVPRVGSPDRTADSPMENFECYVDMGFFPPPEVMIAIRLCFQKYLASAGDISLDEAFFGVPHKKRESYAYRKHRKWKFKHFHSYLDGLERKRKHLKETNKPKKSLEQLVEQYLSSLFPGGDPGVDVDTFLRGYRRWKEEYKIKD